MQYAMDCDMSDLLDEDNFDFLRPDPEGLPNEEVPGQEEVRLCFCQSIPCHMPSNYTPCNLPEGAVLARREIQMLGVFKDSLLGLNGAPPKTQTIRNWCANRADEHQNAYIEGKWVRVWRGQGHKSTIGWLKVTSWTTMMIGHLTQGDCVREGCPHLTTEQFTETFFPKLTPLSEVIRIQFEFRVCPSVL